MTVAGIATGYGIAKTTNHGAVSHQHSGELPTEAGQSAFSAIAEIVESLSNDPKPIGARSNIAALREHLVDMDALTLGADIEMETIDNAVCFTRQRPIAKPYAHYKTWCQPTLVNSNKMPVWNVNGTATDNGATLRITPSKDTDIEKVKALGFFGLMATGAHHQPHHLAMGTRNQCAFALI